MRFMQENYVAKPCGSWNLYPSAFHFMKENYLEKPCGSWNPYLSAFYEGELPGEALRELESLS